MCICIYIYIYIYIYNRHTLKRYRINMNEPTTVILCRQLCLVLNNAVESVTVWQIWFVDSHSSRTESWYCLMLISHCMKICHDHFHALPNSSLIFIFSCDAVQVSSHDPNNDLFLVGIPQNPLQFSFFYQCGFFLLRQVRMVENAKVCVAGRKIAQEVAFRKFKKIKRLGEIRIHIRVILK